MIELYAKTDLALEQVSLRLLKVDDSTRALRLYLGKRLNSMSAKNESQVIMISSWILELMLIDYDIKEDNLRLEKGGDIDLGTDEIKFFLKQNQAKLNTSTVYSLFNRHGRQNLALMYAEIIHDYETLTQLHLHNHEWSEALKVIGSALERVVDASTQQALCDSKELATAAISACEASEPVNAAAISVIKEMIAQC